MIRLIVGFDQREAVAYHVFCQTVLEKASCPVSFIPLAINTLSSYHESKSDGSNRFTYSRFLTPYLCEFEGWAIYMDGDMVCRADIAELLALRDETKPVMVVQHNYQTRFGTKYLGNKNENYPRKNWSSVILWNCQHPENRILTPEFIQNQTGAYLHRFSWLKDHDIGVLPPEWNWLTTEYPDNSSAKILHYTLGTPCFRDYSNAPMATDWHAAHARAQEGVEG